MLSTIVGCFGCRNNHVHSLRPACNIGSKTSLAKQVKLPLKFTCPAGTSTCPTTLLNKGELHWDSGRTLPKTLLAEPGKLGSCSVCPIAVFLTNSIATCNGANGYVAHYFLFGISWPDGHLASFCLQTTTKGSKSQYLGVIL